MKSTRSFGFLSVLAAGVAVGVAGCGTNPEPTSVVCTDFRAGSDLSESTFGVEGELQQSYGAFAQAAGDLAAVANQMLRDVGASCLGLAVELGADPDDARARDKSEPDAVRAWCKIAAERFTEVRPRLKRSHFAVQIVTPKCATDTKFQVACEQKCLGKAACTETPTEERCPVDARVGVCAGTCSGACTGSETAMASCAGKCSGSCFGTCAKEDDEATDCSGGCVCTTICTGACTGACAVPEAGGHCDALCAGGCSEPMRAQTCTQPLAPPTCAGDIDCQKSCSASGAARAVCPDGSLAVVIDAEARAEKDVARIIGALERHLPLVFLAARGRAQVLHDGASDVLDSAGHILNHADQLGPMGAACGMLIGQTGDEARKSLTAALEGSKDLANAVSGESAAAPKGE
jgi:hypothetical protein